MSKKVLVTGGTGFIGRGVVKCLLQKGHKVQVLDNDSRGSVSQLGNLLDDIEIINADVRDNSAIEKVTRDKDIVVHLAYINGTEYFYSKPYEILDVGIRGMLNLLESHKKNKYGRLLLASTSEVYQTPLIVPTSESVALIVPDVLNPRFSYGGGKIASELLLANYSFENGLDYKIFRPHNIYGPNMGYEHVIPQLIRKIIAGVRTNGGRKIEIEIQGDGNQTRAFCHIEDFVKGFMLILDDNSQNRIFHIGKNQETSIKELLSLIAKEMQVDIEIKNGPILKGSTERRCPDISLLESMGYSPEISLEEGLKDTVNWYARHYKV